MRRTLSLILFSLVVMLCALIPAPPAARAQGGSQAALVGKIAFTSNRSGKYQIYVMNADGSNLVQVTWDKDTDNFGPDLSPDGQKILFSSGDLATGDYGFKVVDSTGLHPAILTKHGELSAAHPQWSPDSTRIIFGLLVNNSVDSYLVNADGTNRIKLNYPRPQGVPQVKWVSNSQIILNTPEGIMLANPDATNRKMLVPNGAGSFALNAQLVIEAGYVHALDGYMNTVDIADASGSHAQRKFALPASGVLYYLSWSPDSRYVGANVRGLGDNRQLDGYYVYDTQNQSLFRASTDLWAVWSPDSQYISYTNADKAGIGQIFVDSPTQGATPHQLTFGQFTNAQPSWSTGSVTDAVY